MVQIIDKVYQTGREVADDFKKNIEIQRLIQTISNLNINEIKEYFSRFITFDREIKYVVIKDQEKLLLVLPSSLSRSDLTRIIKKSEKIEKKKFLGMTCSRLKDTYNLLIKHRGMDYYIGVSGKEIFYRNKNYLYSISILLFVVLVIGFLVVLLVSKMASKKFQKIMDELGKSNLRFKMLFDSINNGVVFCEAYNNGEDFIIKDINRAVEDIEKVNKKDIVGKRVTEVFPGIKDFGLFEIFQRVYKTGIPEKHKISFYKDEIREGWKKNFVFKLSTGEIIAVYEDVTAEKVAELKLREKDKQLQQAQKLEAIGRLAGGVAHDFNNILTAIIGYSEIMLLGNELPQELAEYANEIKKAAERGSKLTYQLLAFSRKQILQLEDLNLNAIVEDTAKLLKRIIGEDIEMVMITDPNLLNIKADSTQIVQVVMNLAVNARDAMPDGGKLVIETKNVFLDETYCERHNEIKPGRYVMLAVSDTGIGMDEKTRRRIFEPFFTTKKDGKGTGLGLSTVYGIVKQMGGFIYVYSEVEKGSVFKIYFPAFGRSNEKEVENNVGKYEIVRNDEGNILVVEDEDSVRDIIYTTLTNYGYTVFTASDGIEALKKYGEYNNESNEGIDLLITDVVMPYMNGKELYDRIKLIQPDLKVLFISGYTDNSIVHNGMIYNSINFLQKPFNSIDLVKRVSEIISKKDMDIVDE